jgi:hypothetical protein
MKYKSFVELEQDNNSRYNQCLTQKIELARSRQVAQSLHHQHKSAYIRSIRQEKNRISHEVKQSMLSFENKAKEQTQEIRYQEQRLK